MKGNKILTTGNVKTLVRLYNSGKTAAEIVDFFDGKGIEITPTTVYYHLEKNGVAMRPRGRRPATVNA